MPVVVVVEQRAQVVRSREHGVVTLHGVVDRVGVDGFRETTEEPIHEG